jgi:hypothetical protein
MVLDNLFKNQIEIPHQLREDIKRLVTSSDIKRLEPVLVSTSKFYSDSPWFTGNSNQETYTSYFPLLMHSML